MGPQGVCEGFVMPDGPVLGSGVGHCTWDRAHLGSRQDRTMGVMLVWNRIAHCARPCCGGSLNSAPSRFEESPATVSYLGGRHLWQQSLEYGGRDSLTRSRVLIV